MKRYATASLLALAGATAMAQGITLAEVKNQGGRLLTAAEVKEAVSGAKTAFTLVNGSHRYWTNEPDGTFRASRDAGAPARRSAKGTWSVMENGSLCLSFDWGMADTDSWCRQVYRLGDKFYAYAPDAQDTARSGEYLFTK
jgi:hypothetical protein